MRKIDKTTLLNLVKQYGTPLYVFDEAVIRRQCNILKEAVSYPDTIFRYACKALSNGEVLKIIRSEGYQADTSSFNEVRRCLRAGFAASEILYTGEGADRAEFQQMLEIGVQINCSSIDQMLLVAALKPGSKISLRFNPGEGHGHHQKVNTGGPHSKHGIYIDQADQTIALAENHNLQINGIHTHIGSGADLSHWLKIKDITLNLARRFKNLEFIDLGGGLPVVYQAGRDQPMPVKQWGAALSDSMREFSAACGKRIQLQLEPGRFLVAESGLLLAEIQSFKSTPQHTFAIVNTGFNHNPRPVMYGAYHPIEFLQPGEPDPAAELLPYIIAGNLCESGDIFTVDGDDGLSERFFPRLSVGDIMQMGIVGAYSYSMMSEYNSMNLPAAVMILQDGSARLIERRGTFEDLLRREV